MTDYALNRLSSRSFEHLVQSLAVKVLGPGISVFGDGPDGGREATFEGKVPFPSPEDPWDGYGVIQAKFLQRPQGTPKDGDWAVDQLRHELEKFLDPDRDLRDPDYFVYVTNVVLTPVYERGSKDRARALLDDFKSKTSLKGYAVWDYDQICRFLDADQDVRTVYSPSITPGDVLSAIFQRFHPSIDDMEEVLAGFLQKELLSDEFVNLDQAGHSTEEGIPLSRVFVDLPTADEPNASYALLDERLDDLDDGDENQSVTENGFIRRVLTVASERLDAGASDVAEAVRSLQSTVSPNAQGRIVLIGGPGQGKSTLGQFICQIFRASIISQRPSHTLSPETHAALSLIQEHCEGEDINGEVVPRFPFRLSLSDFAIALSESSDTGVNSVFAYLVRQIARRTDKHIDPVDLQRFLGHYPSAIVFDGLDEVPASSNRNQVLGAIRDFWVDAARLHADILCIATTRPQGYNEDFSPRYYSHCRLTELPQDLGMHFAQRLVEVRYGTAADRKERVLENLQRAFNNEATSRLMRSPLQITIMTSLVGEMGQPPQARWDLFKSYYQVIYKREIEKNIPASAILNRHSLYINTLHYQVGLLLQIESERTGATNAKLARQRFSDLVEVHLGAEGYEGSSLHTLAQEIVEAAAERLVFLVELEEEQIGFEIRSLQEFMAAQCLMEGKEKDILRRLEEIAPIQFWRNVFLFAAGQCFSERPTLRDTVLAICASLNEVESDEIAAACLAGSDLAIALLDEGLALGQPKYAQMLARVAVRCLDLASPNLQARFARVHESQLDSIYQEEIKRRIVSERGIGFVGAWNCLLRLVSGDVPWAVQLANDYWPTDAQLQLDILEASYQPMGNPWTAGKAASLLPKMAPEHLKAKLAFGLVNRTSDVHSLRPEDEAAFEVMNPYYSDDRDILKVLHSNISYYRIVRLNGKEAGYLRRLQTSEHWHEGWTIYHHARKFLEGPSKESLSSVLESLAEAFDPAWIAQFEKEAPMLPWPMLACLTASTNRMDLLNAAERSLNGELGDVADWEAAENRWSVNGITKDDLLSMTMDRLPFDRRIGDVGFPTTLKLMPIIFPPQRDYESVGEWLDVFHSAPEGETKRFVARAINWSLLAASFHTLHHPIIDQPTIDTETLRSIYRLVPPDSVIPADVLMRMLDKHGCDMLDVFETLETSRFRFVFHEQQTPQQGDIAELLYKSYVKNGHNPALMPILAGAAERGISCEQPVDMPTPDEVETPEQKSAALLIHLARESWQTDCADDWIRVTREVANSNNEIYRRVMVACLRYEAAGPYRNKYLAALGREIPSDDFRSHQAHAQLLGDVIDKRTSDFYDSGSNGEFNLPSGIVFRAHN